MSVLLSTGISGLDSLLRGGLPRGHLYLIEGDPGAGKTTLSLQFLLEGRKQGERGLYCTLSESRAEIEKVAASHGWNLDGITILAMSHGVESATGEDEYTVFRPADIELGETTKRILEEFERVGPVRVAIDSLSELRLLAHEPLRYRRQILGLKHYFAQRDCTVLILDDRTVRTTDSQPQSIAHGIIELDRMSNEFGGERRRVRISKLRGVAFREGFHDFVIRSGGLQVFTQPSFNGDNTTFDERPAPTGRVELDQLLGGGLDRGTSTLLIGPAGTGKSTLGASMAIAAAQRGERVAIFAFEESRRIALRRATSLGLDLRSQLDSNRISFRHILPAELSPGEFASIVRDAVERDGARMIVIDSLNGYLAAMPEERFLPAQMHELLGYLNSHGVLSVMVLALRGMMGPGMQATVDVSYLADTVIMLRHFEAFGAVRKAISVVKKRSGHHEDTIRELFFDSKGIRVGAVLSDFRGVLTGVPIYQGTERDLLSRGGDRER